MGTKKKKYKGDKYAQKKHQEKGPVKAKKHLGQHFLKDENIAKQIADSLTLNNYDTVLEIGPGMGVLTKYLLDKKVDTSGL